MSAFGLLPRSSRLFVLGATLLVASLTVACDDPEADCDHLLDRWCVKVDSCVGGDQYDVCMSDVRQVINCGDVESVNDDYDRCLDEIEAITCSSLGALPASCIGVFERE